MQDARLEAARDGSRLFCCVTVAPGLTTCPGAYLGTDAVGAGCRCSLTRRGAADAGCANAPAVGTAKQPVYWPKHISANNYIVPCSTLPDCVLYRGAVCVCVCVVGAVFCKSRSRSRRHGTKQKRHPEIEVQVPAVLRYFCRHAAGAGAAGPCTSSQRLLMPF